MNFGLGTDTNEPETAQRDGRLPPLREWAEFGPVCVSEYTFPLGRIVWEKSRARKLIAGSGKRAVEHLYLVTA